MGIAIKLHNIPHVFGGRHGTDTASLKSNLLQRLEAMREEVLYEIFLYLHLSYESLERERFLDIL